MIYMSESVPSNGSVPHPIKPPEHLLREDIATEDIRIQMHNDYVAVLAAGSASNRREELLEDWRHWRGHVPKTLMSIGRTAVAWVRHNTRS